MTEGVFFHLKFRILGDFEDIFRKCLMSCPESSNFTGQDIGWSQLSSASVPMGLLILVVTAPEFMGSCHG